jgi:formylglycine-generating enzyme required for sulfatase activity
MVLVLTPNAIASQFVKDEVQAALLRVSQSHMHDVIPMLAAPCMLGTIPPQWSMLRRYDATQDYPAALAGVLRAVGLPPILPSTKPVALQPARAPVVVRSAGSAIPDERFPPSLAQLGFEGLVINGIEVIIPPVCDVPAGAFLMGSVPKRDHVAAKESWTNDEQPQHTVNLPAYEIACFPVTVAEYACFVRAGHPEPAIWQKQQSKLDHPVVAVTWYDAVAYAAWLTGQTGEHFRLPTEAEWEKAARGTDARIYPWGDVFDQARCNTNESGIKTTTPVGSFPTGASPYGVHDMAGNVWEWTSSRYVPYPYSIPMEPEDAHSPENRVLRGGSWSYGARNARAACRDLDLPGNFRGSLGFRLARLTPSS